MNDREPKSGDPAPARGESTRLAADDGAQMRSELTQLIELQREQQVTLQRFIALQERLLAPTPAPTLLSGAGAGAGAARFEAPRTPNSRRRRPRRIGC